MHSFANAIFNTRNCSASLSIGSKQIDSYSLTWWLCATRPATNLIKSFSSLEGMDILFPMKILTNQELNELVTMPILYPETYIRTGIQPPRGAQESQVKKQVVVVGSP